MSRSFAPGEVIVRSEVLDGKEWVVYPVRVVLDAPDLLAVYVHQGTRLTFGGSDFSLGAHPWAASDRFWRSAGVLQLQRPGDWYAVWGRWEGDEFADWYVNFQRPLRRTDRGFDTLDLELDLVIPADGSAPRWKDLEEFEARAGRGEFEPEEADAVRRAAREVRDAVGRGRDWWESWRDWRMPEGWSVPGAVELASLEWDAPLRTGRRGPRGR
ncbi:DUF402 domain-containing protein [Streptomyces acidiscabies]|uniref:DUF402 domain-containing protein n=1 Tax=Streptomyces acidiscabies TaxID=42234 RepID=A0AAP6BEP2_9ACTN|nr:DUF402 domain-containing protein [Streptomyces acidiscabies]MBP5942054.1 DUF402 domain-containing protein [Streptomyces sp. LBUM 1476]MBZ3913536.1 DUF402 domain-containing protein [Streptomyces acidiscabies]MDX2963373.1 DUF402 domain-containing protein [Streptomyces acidiscabies]MDX3023107.1 DUF402 domain-containing protein [Streptomyces acidiscabies]MDX3792749.1 DUF402 domain-containing protein [Streptomyces acidiscabies]